MNPLFCPLCGANETEISYKGKVASDLTSLKASGSSFGNRDIFECLICTLFFCSPLPSSAELFEAYNESSDEDFVSQNSYRYNTFDKYFSNFMNKMDFSYKEIHVTDIGAASGVFLSALKNRGISSSGLEANSWLVNYGRKHYGVDLHRGGDLDFVPNSEMRNIVTYWDVLEHLPDPKSSISFMASALRKESIIFLSLPSTDSKSFKFLKWYWPMHLDVHLFYFNQKSLDALFSNLGFKRIYVSNYWQTISIGYLILRILRIISFNRFSNLDSTKFTDSWLNRIPFPYSVGQRIYVYEKVK